MDATEIPSTLVLGTWSKDSRSKVRAFMEKGPFCWDSMVNCHNWMLNDLCRELCVPVSNDADENVGHNRLSCHQRQTRHESEYLAARYSPCGEMYDDDDIYYDDISQVSLI
ncbi:hypothetical protein AHAS_Ahas18G0137700 [Arachis hypogaea]